MEMGVEAGTMTREQADAYLAELSDSRGDMFLNFLTDDLHPRIERGYGTAQSGHGLFGYSYGGLFSLYAWLTNNTFFESIGAGSPGIINADSQVFARLQAMGDTLPATKLHVTSTTERSSETWRSTRISRRTRPRSFTASPHAADPSPAHSCTIHT